MRIFITGATGFIGMALVKELRAAGHQVLGLCRTPEKASALSAAGAEVLAGSVNDGKILAAGAARADGIVHLAFNHDFSTFVQNCEDDRNVVETLGAALAGSDRPLIVTSGTLIANTPGRAATEDDVPTHANPRAASEEAVQSLAAKGINASVMRLPQVHDPVRQGLVTYAIAIARAKGVFAYIGDGHNRWSAGHVDDVARLYRLAIEKAVPGARYHAVAEEGVSHRDIADVVGRRLNLPVTSIAPEAAEGHFGWLAPFLARDAPASSALTRQRLGWEPSGPTLLADLDRLQQAAA